MIKTSIRNLHSDKDILYDLLPHNKDIQSPAIQDAISIMNQMGERQTEYIVKILKIYQASHQD